MVNGVNSSDNSGYDAYQYYLWQVDSTMLQEQEGKIMPGEALDYIDELASYASSDPTLKTSEHQNIAFLALVDESQLKTVG